jgi:hypothetical protein
MPTGVAGVGGSGIAGAAGPYVNSQVVQLQGGPMDTNLEHSGERFLEN